ncbi:hypothetical protein ACERII_18920 [Evansella sp. AB-rgal1]|uniref:hypothetical protein n=1 Tax=Evansella sp. AB-rgal1 TaxID=3242696 RepID=UPI00359EB891
MFFSFILFLLFIGIAGLAVGALISVKVWFSIPLFLILIAALCFGFLWFGVLIGAAFFSWLPIFFTKLVIISFCIGLAVFFFRIFHPSYGYFPFRGWIHWALLAVFFFIIGIDFASVGFSAWLLLIILPLFAGAIFFGTIMMQKVKTMYRSASVLIYLPLLLFVFLGLFKLI